MFGEWLWCKHSVGYDALPSYFLAFDLMERKTGKFLCYRRVKEILGDKVDTVPVIWAGNDKEDFKKSVNSETLSKKSSVGNEQIEGVYLRFEDEEYVLHRLKLRRKTFAAGREGFSHKVITNTVKPKEQEQ